MNLSVTAIWLVTFVDYSYQTNHQYGSYTVPAKLDNFTFGKADQFDLRFLVSEETIPTSPEPPLLLYCGNQGEVTLFADNFGFLYELAKEFDAVLAFVEHRGYGTTLTDKNGQLARENYQYLTMNHVIEDIIYFVDYFNNNDEKGVKRPKPLNRPVFLFGASYGGTLAVYTKYKFNDKIAGVIASGTSLLDYYGLRPNNAVLKQVTDIIAATTKGAKCKENISKSWAVVEHYVLNEQDWLVENWHLVKDKPIGNDGLPVFISWITTIYVVIAVFNYPYETNFLMPMPANPVEKMCEYLGEDNLDDENLMRAVYSALSVYLNYQNDANKVNDWTTGISNRYGTATFDIQKCIDIVAPIWADGKTDIFWSPAPFDYDSFVKKPCEDDYGLTPDPVLALKQFGDEKAFFNFENMIFTNSKNDPWNYGNPRKNFYKSSIVFVNYEKEAHMQDFFASRDDDADDLRHGRDKIRESIKTWMDEWQEQQKILQTRNLDEWEAAL